MPRPASITAIAAVTGLGLVGLVPVGGRAGVSTPAPRPVPIDLSGYSDARPGRSLRLLFIHHSCGGQLLAPNGADRDRGGCIYDSHPNGGDLRARLTAEGYEVHEASYGSFVGDRTDIPDWPTTFGEKMDRVLRTNLQDAVYDDGRTNEIVVFKSCFPNNDIVDSGEGPRALTVANVKAAMRSLLPRFRAHPEVLFVYLTPPPLGVHVPRERLWKSVIKRAIGRTTMVERRSRSGQLARELNSWVVSRDGWLASYDRNNVVVFDYYGVLADPMTGLSRYTASDDDDHPSAEGNRLAAQAFVPFLDRAVRRAGLVP